MSQKFARNINLTKNQLPKLYYNDKRPSINANLVIPIARNFSASSHVAIEAKALVYAQRRNPKSVLRVHKHTLSPLTPTTLHLKFLASPINPSDINQIEGAYPIKPPFETKLGSQEPIAVAGNEGVAEVIGVGDEVKDIKVGDWVVMAKSGFGTWRTHAVANPEDVARIEPKSISVAQAAVLTVNTSTAYRLLKDFVKLEKGDFVLQNAGNGGVGQDVIQIAKAWGINTINIIRDKPDFEDTKSRLQSLGGTASGTKTYVVKNTEFTKNKEPYLVRHLIGESDIKVPLGLNCVGGEIVAYMAKNIDNSATIVTYGSLQRKPVIIPGGSLFFHNVHLVGFWMAKWKQTHSPEEYQEMLNDLISLIKQGKLGGSAYEENPWGKESNEEESFDNFLKVYDKVQNSHGVKQILRMG